VAYNVKLIRVRGRIATASDAFTVSVALHEIIAKDGRFTFEIEWKSYPHKGDRRFGSRQPGEGFVIRKVRLIAAKPYCGQHPGECFVTPFSKERKPRMKYLEWDDWVAFHALVNKVLDRFKACADVWSRPAEAGSDMWIRRGLRSRVRWEWEDDWTGQAFRPRQIWNPGTDDQFGEEISEPVIRKAHKVSAGVVP
jgi:hypothetical protein